MRFFGRRSAKAKQASEFDDSYWRLNRAELPKRGFGVWKPTVSALALAGVAMIGALFALEGGDENVATSDYSPATLLKDSTQPAHVKVVSSEEQPIDRAQAPLDNASPSGAFGPAAVGAAQPPAGVSGGTPAVATVNTPVAAPPPAAPPPTASQFPDPKTVRAAASLGPDGMAIATRPPSGTDSGEAAQTRDATKPPAKPAPKAVSETRAIAQPSTPKLDSPAKLSGKSSARVVVARTDTTAPSAAMETPSQPVQLVRPQNPRRRQGQRPKPRTLRSSRRRPRRRRARPASSPLILWRVPSANLLARFPGRAAGPFRWPRQNRGPKPGATQRGSMPEMPDMRPRS